MPIQDWPNRIAAAIHGSGNERIDIDCQQLREIPLSSEAGQMKACEVLARLVDSEGRRVKAGEFIEQISVDQELVKLLDRKVLQRLSETHADKDFTFHAVNLSAGSLEDPTTVDFVQGLINQHGIPPKFLCFEITEQVIADAGKALEVINALRGLGCLIALDDFGTGANSLVVLDRYYIDVLKIDGSFIQNMLQSNRTRCIVEHIMSLGKNLGLKIVAEYVSSEEIVEALGVVKDRIEVAQGGSVDLHGQGDWISLPVPCSELA